MLDRLPEYIDPVHLADKRGELKGQIPLSSLDRLADFLADDKGAVSIDLFFSREGHLPIAEGDITANLELICQNCLAAVTWPINNHIKLGMVKTIEQANRLPEGYEPLMVLEDKVLLKNIIEDELLLLLPSFPKHENNCLIPLNNADGTELFLNDEPSSPKKNPFAILATLKKTGEQ
jgi:uncharacterized protein